MKEALSLRRGLGVIYLLSGLAHAAEMTAATLYSLGRIPLVIGQGLWSQLYYAHFLATVLGGAAYLAMGYRKIGLFLPEPLIDFLLGLAAFLVILTFIALLLVRRMLNPWWSLTPSGFLLVYGWELFAGRRLGVPLE